MSAKLVPTGGGTSRRSNSGVLLHVLNQLIDNSSINNSFMFDMRVSELILDFKASVLSIV